MRKNYPSDISREQFEKIRPQLESFRKKTKPRTVDLYDVFCGILYVLTSGCQWRMLPSDFPKWRNVHEYFLIWSQPKKGENKSLLEKMLTEFVGKIRLKTGRNKKTSFIIIDAQSVKNTDTAENKGYDAGKKVSGIKRHIAVDTQGLPHAIHITTANVTDRAGALKAFENSSDSLSAVINVLADSGYTGKPFADGVLDITGASVEIAKRNELHTFKVIPKRWVVERSFGWLEKCRRLWKNCERKLNTSLQMVVLAFLSLLLKRF
jgi:transposase